MVACAILAGAAGAAALARAAAPQRQKSIDDIVRFLQEHEQENGGYADTGKKPTQSISAWVTLALAAAGINPLDQTRTVDGVACGQSAGAHLEVGFAAGVREEIAWPQIATTAFERELLVVDTSGADPHDFAGYDLVAEIIGRQQPDGGIPYVPGGESQVNDAAFGILALAPIEEPAAKAAVQKATEWLLTAEDTDGGFNWQKKGATSEVDLTGAAIEALVAAGDQGTEVEANALAFLHSVQRPDGGFAEYPSSEGESNVASTAWGVQGIWAAGGNPETWVVGAGSPTHEPLDYMESMQQPDGHIRWRASSDLNGIWMTAYALPAFTGQVLTYPLVPRSEAGGEPTEPCPQPAAAPETPAGSSAAKPDEGVGAGGGGDGAPDFSRPQAGSKGKTAGGARITHHAHGEAARDHSRTRRGANLDQASGKETQEPQSSAEADQEVGAVSAAASPSTAAGDAGGDGDGGKGPGARGAPVSVKDAPHAARTTSGEEVSGVVIGSPDGVKGKLAFGAPGLRSAGRGGTEEPWAPLAIAAAAVALLACGVRRELRGRGWGRPT